MKGISSPDQRCCNAVGSLVILRRIPIDLYAFLLSTEGNPASSQTGDLHMALPVSHYATAQCYAFKCHATML